MTLFLVAINSIFRELGNEVNGSLFTDDLAIYITTRKQRMAIRDLQTNTNELDAFAAERNISFSFSKTVTKTFRKRGSSRDNTKKPNYTIQGQHPVLGNDP